MNADLPFERETILRFSEGDEPLTLYTFKAALAARLQKAGATLKREGKREGKVVSWTLEMPKEWFRQPRPARKSTPAADAARAKGRMVLAAKRALANKTNSEVTPSQDGYGRK